ncbi:MAG: 30S ribosomal protein S13 [Candidatus Nezhaarchaeota archaeon]|nr:30S ribosomal protein S13 [Candidatus Nezhaarchaeota archaeon]MCX8141782.1 30S ribosomal protein S13 [Candidatus Nezhaarchaeota archaeon]MDW8050439.1 30S ribosomal protein S13 [Nitrososphaerota archaeon]
MSQEFKHIIRIAGLDIDGSLNIEEGLSKIRGIGHTLARVIVNILDLDRSMRVGYLSEAMVKKIEDVIANPLKYGVPPWALNRQSDIKTGESRLLIGSDLVLTVREDVDRLKRIRCWRGVRHALGLKVRGQRTRTTGRVGLTVGVKKKPK